MTDTRPLQHRCAAETIAAIRRWHFECAGRNPAQAAGEACEYARGASLAFRPATDEENRLWTFASQCAAMQRALIGGLASTNRTEPSASGV